MNTKMPDQSVTSSAAASRQKKDLLYQKTHLTAVPPPSKRTAELTATELQPPWTAFQCYKEMCLLSGHPRVHRTLFLAELTGQLWLTPIKEDNGPVVVSSPLPDSTRYQAGLSASKRKAQVSTDRCL